MISPENSPQPCSEQLWGPTERGSLAALKVSLAGTRLGCRGVRLLSGLGSVPLEAERSPSPHFLYFSHLRQTRESLSCPFLQVNDGWQCSGAA